MSLNDTPLAQRLHIGFFGMRNAGKSSVVNAITSQELSVVSDVKGTTTDPVSKAMELLPIGPVLIIDTPGFDDEGMLGELRIQKTKQVLNKTDVAILVVDANIGKTVLDEELIRLFKEKEIPYLVVYNKADLLLENSASENMQNICSNGNLTSVNKQNMEVTTACQLQLADNEILVSALNNYNIHELKEKIASSFKTYENDRKIISDKLNPSDFVILVVPIDKSAPKGRLILPQQQTIRDIIDADATAIVVKDNELKAILQSIGKKPALVITDSQVFKKVSEDTPADIPLTSFSILMARYKGFLEIAVSGAFALQSIEDGDTILISEGCTHHRQCEDIGTVKLPNMIRKFTNKNVNFEFSSGRTFPEDLSKYKMVIHCGGCTLNEKEMRFRMKSANDQNIPMTNYGTAIAYMQGILERSVELFV